MTVFVKRKGIDLQTSTGKNVRILPKMQFTSKLNTSGKIIIVDGTFKSFSKSSATVSLVVDSLVLERAVSYRANPEFWENLEIVSRQGGPEREIDEISIIDDELEIVYAEEEEGENALSVMYTAGKSTRSYFSTEIYGTKFMGGLARHFQNFDFTLEKGLPLKLSGYFVSFDEEKQQVTVYIDQGLSMAYTVAAVVLVSGVAYLIANQTGFAKMPTTDGIKKSITNMANSAKETLGIDTITIPTVQSIRDKAAENANHVVSGVSNFASRQFSAASGMIAALPGALMQNQLYSSVFSFLKNQEQHASSKTTAAPTPAPRPADDVPDNLKYISSADPNFYQKLESRNMHLNSSSIHGGGSYYTIPIDQNLPFWKNLVSKTVLCKAARGCGNTSRHMDLSPSIAPSRRTASRRTPSRRSPSRRTPSRRTVSRRS